MRLEGRRAMVTGGAQGIGAAIAERLAAEGADVVIGDLKADEAAELAGRIGGRAGLLDVTSPEGVAEFVAEHGPFEILVNNAGTDEFGFFTQTTPEQWERVMAVNLGGVFACTHAVLPAMQDAGYGRIVSIASEAGRVGSKGSAVYSAAKGAVIAFMKVIARENARYAITANSIAPITTLTPRVAALRTPEQVEAIMPEKWRAYFDQMQLVHAADGSASSRDVAHAPIVESFAQRAKAGQSKRANTEA